MTSRTALCLAFVAVAACSGSSATSDGPSDSGAGSGNDGGASNDGGTTDNDGSTGNPDGGGITPSTGVTVIVEPNGNHGVELVNAIKAATTSVYMTMYQLDNTAVITAIKNQISAGHDVKVVLDGSTTNKSGNTNAYNAFNTAKAGTAVWSNPAFTYTHEKCVILDAKEAWIMTMNLNESSADDDRELLAIDDDAADVTEATAIFNADFATSSITPSGNLVVSPTNSRPDLVALIGTATKSLDLEVEEFSDTDKNGIVDAVVAIANKGIPVRLVIGNNTPDSTGPQAVSDVDAAHGKVVKTGGTDGDSTSSNPYIAAKTILIDCVTGTCTQGYVGSENFTANSLEYNRELGVVFSDPTELAKIYAAVNTDFAAGTPQ